MTGWLWLLLTVGGVALLGFAIARGMALTSRRRQNPAAQRLTNAATKDLYRDEEIEREREEGDDEPPRQPTRERVSR